MDAIKHSALAEFIEAAKELHDPDRDPELVSTAFNLIGAQYRPYAKNRLKDLHDDALNSIVRMVLAVPGYKIHRVSATSFVSWGSSIEGIVPNTLVSFVFGSDLMIDDLMVTIQVMGLSYQVFISSASSIVATEFSIAPSRVEYVAFEDDSQDLCTFFGYHGGIYSVVLAGDDWDDGIEAEADFDEDEILFVGKPVHVVYANMPTTRYYFDKVLSSVGLPTINHRVGDLTSAVLGACVRDLSALFEDTVSVSASIRVMHEIAEAGREESLRRLFAQL